MMMYAAKASDLCCRAFDIFELVLFLEHAQPAFEAAKMDGPATKSQAIAYLEGARVLVALRLCVDAYLLRCV
jgi:hypothetical protein